MTEEDCPSIQKVLQELNSVAPDAPFLALGQTIFWDEPMKAGIVAAGKRLGFPRKLVAGVHDTDYFAKLPSGAHRAGRFRSLPHNDTTTRGLWSAAAEFSTLFGSETVITREMLQSSGVRISKVLAARPSFLDEATEAWGWRGVVSLDEKAPITKDVILKNLFPELQATLDWVLDSTLDVLVGEGKDKATELADFLRSQVCELSEDSTQTLSQFYKKLLPVLYEFCSGSSVDLEATATSELLQFNRATCSSSRFELLDLFVNQATREMACKSYDSAIHGSPGLYELSRFGSGAIPFDLIIPGHGRGTIRLGTRGAVIMTPVPQFLTYREPLTSVRDLADLVEAKFGSGCVLVGKAVTLIGMLAREFVFVFHEGASSYVRSSRILHQILAQKGFPLEMKPILRVKYDIWGAMSVCCSWLKLPEPFQRAFGTEELCAPSFSARWKEVGHEQESLLSSLSRLRRPIELIRFLDKTQGGSWQVLAEEYERLHDRLGALETSLAKIQQQRSGLYDRMRELRIMRVKAEKAKGDHFRAAIFEKSPSSSSMAERLTLTEEVERVVQSQFEARREIANLRVIQNQLVHDDEIRRIHDRRRSIELEAELKRSRLIRQAVISSKGLANSNLRPSAWWFPLVCPDGLWFRETIDTAECYLEPLI